MHNRNNLFIHASPAYRANRRALSHGPVLVNAP
jgi:hypothetical protein